MISTAALSQTEINENHSPQQKESFLEINVRLLSTEIGIEPLQYHRAVEADVALMNDDQSTLPKTLEERLLYHDLMSHWDTEESNTDEYQRKLVTLFNQVNSDMASFYGLSVSQYLKFRDVFDTVNSTGKYRDIKLVGAEKN